MKAKLNTLIFSALLLAGWPAKAQFADNRDFRNDDAGIVINNYYDDYDYYYSSRINRFHRSYAAFDYYSPVFTETYWYNYQPYSWGTSIYGRSALGFGFAVNFPVYYYGWGTDYIYDYNYGWYDPYYGSSWYWGYDPFYYSFYSPVYININVGPRWGNTYRYGHYFWYNDYRPIFHTTNNYYYNSSPLRNSYRPMPDRRPDGYSRSAGAARKESVPYSGKENQATRNNAPDTRRDNNSGNSNNGNNINSRTGGNRGNFDQNDRNVNNNGNNNNSRPDGNNGNSGNKSGNERISAPSRTQANTPAGPRNDQSSGRSITAPSRISSRERNNATVSQGRNSSGSQAARSSGQSSRSGSSSSNRSSAKSSSDSKSDESKSRSSRR